MEDRSSGNARHYLAADKRIRLGAVAGAVPVAGDRSDRTGDEKNDIGSKEGFTYSYWSLA